MTKRELYDALTAAGVKLPAYNRINLQVLQEQAAIYLQPEKPEEQEEPETVETVDNGEAKQGTPPVLIFKSAGWCEALHTSYFIGHYQPTSWEEYEALRPFASGGVR